MMEAWLVALISGAWGPDRGDAGLPAADLGALTPASREAAEACARALGYGDEESKAKADGLDRELAREPPYRPRLFRLLARRVAGRGRPVVLVPLSHGRPSAVRLTWGEPAAITGCKGENATVLGADGSRRTVTIEGFARDFVEKNLP